MHFRVTVITSCGIIAIISSFESYGITNSFTERKTKQNKINRQIIQIIQLNFVLSTKQKCAGNFKRFPINKPTKCM